MRDAVGELANQIRWKVVVLDRVRQFYGVGDMFDLWKSDVLSVIEYRTPAIAHANRSVLADIDGTQDRFLRPHTIGCVGPFPVGTIIVAP